ncbi:MAG TPA: 2-C-methyl-D-erythritol 4-phosphate cytidylyltransferase [Burkholderiaceae bacterium]|nr:2-C-methyl-D-erythritol 4-phosphate cytidylyltransferase [Burkholderiaceae bacterium]
MTDRLFALIPAAGTGARMGTMVPKQYQRLGRQTMLEHAIDALLAAPDLEHVLVVVSPNDIAHRELAPRARVSFVTVGGATRAESVRNGLRVLRASVALHDDDWVLVHDAARPCLAREELMRLMTAVADDEVGGLLAVPVADTLKRAAGGRVAATVERDGLWRAATPQMFRAGLLARALANLTDDAAPTDEAAAVERLQLRPRLVEGLTTNIKVTVPSDWPLAEAILRAQGRWT